MSNNQDDLIERAIKSFFQKLKDREHKKKWAKIVKEDPDLANTMKKLEEHSKKISELLKSF